MRILKIKTKTGIKTVYNVIDWGWNAETGDGEYCDQWMRGEDSGDGIYYYPIEGSTQYFWVAYSF